jgi:hypothetical protein|tara:strand:- start:379 stop:651 length:273 start_codon:yes stop_codon:yes gene_type:complete
MYKVTFDYRLLIQDTKYAPIVCKFWYINGVPYTFDEIDFPEIELLESCELIEPWTIDELYKWSSYLVMEEMHPLLFEFEDQIECECELPN